MVLLDTDSDFVLCGREWSCWILTATLYSVAGNGLAGHRQPLCTVVVNSCLGHLQRLFTV